MFTKLCVWLNVTLQSLGNTKLIILDNIVKGN